MAGLPVTELQASPRRVLAPAWSWLRSGRASWEVALGALAIVAAIAALWITLGADFLRYPGWLAVQKADFILGPIGVGLYWHHRRPGNRLGLLLILIGLFGVLYIGSSIDASVPFGIGVFSGLPLVLGTRRRSSPIRAAGSGRWRNRFWSS